MNQKEQEFFTFLDTRKQEVLEESKTLAGDHRKDESNVLKAKANIYDIFKAIWGAAKSMSGDDCEFKEVFDKKAAMIPAQWEASLVRARENNDVAKIMIEEAKLAAVAEVRQKVASLF